jgi:hypothetical protein
MSKRSRPIDPVEELATIRKSLVKARSVCQKLEKEQEQVHINICDIEKEKARKERIKFIHNIQISKVPSLLKRRLDVDEDDLEEAAVLRDYVFGMNDLLPQITEYLGPMEYFMFSRTSKKLALALTDTFDVWGKLFLSYAQRERSRLNPRYQAMRENPIITPLIEKFQLLKQNRESALLVLPMLLSVWQRMFVAYRLYGDEMRANFQVYQKSTYSGNLQNAHLFVENRETKQLCRASEYNLLVSTHSSKQVGDTVSVRFFLKHGFPLLKSQEEKKNKVVPLDYFLYEDLNTLNLDRSNKRRNCGHGVFMVDPLDAKISELSGSKQFRLRVLEPPGHHGSKVFCDEYECYSIILAGMNKFKPKYVSTESLLACMSTLISSSVSK